MVSTASGMWITVSDAELGNTIMTRLLSSASVAMLGLSASLPSTARADELRTIADVDTVAPGGTGNFTNFGKLAGFSPAISGDNIAFGAGTEQSAGIYAQIDGQLIVVADTTTHMPGTASHFGFSLFNGSGPTISGRNVAFAAPTLERGDAIWAKINGEFVLIADRDTLVPGSTGTFRSFGSGNGARPSISGENVAFIAIRADGLNGIYARIDGELRVVADTDTLVPGETVLFRNFAVLDGTSPSISGRNVAFGGIWDAGDPFLRGGIFALINGELRAIAKTGDPRPEGVGFVGTTFGTFSLTQGAGPSISGQNVAFQAVSGIYAFINGSMRKVADWNTAAPNGGGNFNSFDPGNSGSPSISGENVTFLARTETLGWGIFAYTNGALEVVADANTPVPGETFNFSDVSVASSGGAGPAISGRNVVFQTAPPGGIYARIHVAPIPATTDWSLVALTLGLVAAAAIVLRSRRRGFPTSRHFVRH